MAKKDFSDLAASTVYGDMKRATGKQGQQAEATPEEVLARQEALQTGGRKGCKAVRINMAFTPRNHEFVKVIARISGQSMAQVVNHALDLYRESHSEIYEQAKAIIDKM